MVIEGRRNVGKTLNKSLEFGICHMDIDQFGSLQ